MAETIVSDACPGMSQSPIAAVPMRAESKPFAERPDPRSDERKDEKRCDIAESHPRVEGIAEYGLVNASGKDADNVGAAQPCDENAHAEIAGG